MFLTLVGAALFGAGPQVGDTAPDVSGVDIDGAPFELSKLVEKGPVVLAFIVKAFTPG